MAIDNQQETVLPTPGNNNRKSADLLPRFYRTDSNKKFLQATVDQLTQPGSIKKINGYIGRENAKSATSNEIYLKASSTDRQNYQLEPAAVIQDYLGNVTFYKDYIDHINHIEVLGGIVNNHERINKQEFYSWNPHICWDKLINFQEYYWMPNGPNLLTVTGQQRNIESTLYIRSVYEGDNYAYIFTPDGLTRNPSVTLYRGQTYTFNIDAENNPFTIKTVRSTGVSDLYSTGVSEQSLEEGSLTFTVPFDAPDVLFYVSETNIDAGGIFFIKDITENTFLDIDSDIIGKQNYKTSAGFSLSNGMKIKFSGKVTPEIYSTGEWYVTGVGGSISLTSAESQLEYTEFTEKDYIVINKGSFDKSPWSKYNYWVHKDVIEQSSTILGIPPSLDQSARASRPIIEFAPGIRLHNFGYKEKISVDLVDTFTQDAFSIVNGSTGYNIDGVDLADGMRVIFLNDPDVLVNGKVFQVEFINISVPGRIIEFNTRRNLNDDTSVFTFDLPHSLRNLDKVVYLNNSFDNINGLSNRVIYTVEVIDDLSIRLLPEDETDFENFIEVSKTTEESQVHKFEVPAEGRKIIRLFETVDTDPNEGEVILVKNGAKNKGKFYWFDGTAWLFAQQKTKVNQPPLFEIYDKDKVSFSNYEASSFSGTKLFSYKEGTGTNDPILGFPLSYLNINNIGDILFDFNLTIDDFTYNVDSVIVIKKIDSGFLQVRNFVGEVSYENGWIKSKVDNSQPIVRIFKESGLINNFPIDVFDNIQLVNDIKLDVYVNGVKLMAPQFEIIPDRDKKIVKLSSDVKLTDIVSLEIFSKSPKNANGYYKIPINLQHNPLNENLTRFTLGQVTDHVTSIVSNFSEFEGNYPGSSNLRDIMCSTAQYGTKIVQHSSPLNFSIYHLGSKEANLVKALEAATEDYGKFKRAFINAASTSSITSSPKKQVDHILTTMFKDLPKDSSYYLSDMFPYTGFNRSEIQILDSRIKHYPLVSKFSLDSLSNQSVLVYLNGDQLLAGIDYTFTDNQEFIFLIKTAEENDILEIFEYSSTDGAFCPPTPTKLGLYPKFEPKIFIDDTYLEPTKVIQGHDGSITVAFNDYRDDLILELEKRIFNNIKIQYNSNLFDIFDYIPGYNRTTDYSREEFDRILAPMFFKWAANINQDYTNYAEFDRSNPYTFNYRGNFAPDGRALPAYWRGIYKWFLDTDRPHTHPWECLGFTIQPSWWNTVYGNAPYTRNNEILWNDISQGIIREPNKPIVKNSKIAKPILKIGIPVDELGNIVNPIDSNYVQGFIKSTPEGFWTLGDYAPVENAWRKSSYYPFSLIQTFVLMSPSKTLSTAFDLSRISRNLADQLVYTETNLRISLNSLILPSTVKSLDRNFSAGLVNYIVDYIDHKINFSIDTYVNNLKSLTNKIGLKVGGFTSKPKFKLILDSKNPSATGGVFVPEENYSIFLNTSSPIKKIAYSGVIITSFADGFEIKGYINDSPYFNYYPWNKTGKTITIGGISETFLRWEPGETYVAGKVVFFNGKYYRCKITNSSTDFDLSYFTPLPELPVVGGQQATLRTGWEKNNIQTLAYSSKLRTIQEVVDFLQGYGEYLKDQGFIFDNFDKSLGTVSNWENSINEFLFWTTQNWDVGSAIALSPAAQQLSLDSKISVVQSLFDEFYGYKIFRVDGVPLSTEFTNIYRQDSAFSLSSKNTNHGIYGAVLYLVQKEHVLILDNTTLFNDIIYDLPTGYKQDRLRVIGYQTKDWTGGFNIPGFIFDDANIKEWQPWTDYPLGETVKYKEFYYSSKVFTLGKAEFDPSDWILVNEKPTAQLLPNWDYKSKQFLDFYDLDTDNFDVEQQRIAQHLIGYQKRSYLQDIIKDDISQYKFYQGMISEKGTQNSLSKLFDILSDFEKPSFEFNEEWAVRVGNFGAIDAIKEIEIPLVENSFRLNPQPVEISDRLDATSIDLIYRLPYGAIFNQSGSNPLFSVIDNSERFLRTAGFTSYDEVKLHFDTLEGILPYPIDALEVKDYVWTPFEDISRDPPAEAILANQDTEGVDIVNSTTFDIDTTIFDNSRRRTWFDAEFQRSQTASIGNFENLSNSPTTANGISITSWNIYSYEKSNAKVNAATYSSGLATVTYDLRTVSKIVKRDSATIFDNETTIFDLRKTLFDAYRFERGEDIPITRYEIDGSGIFVLPRGIRNFKVSVAPRTIFDDGETVWELDLTIFDGYPLILSSDESDPNASFVKMVSRTSNGYEFDVTLSTFSNKPRIIKMGLYNPVLELNEPNIEMQVTYNIPVAIEGDIIGLKNHKFLNGFYKVVSHTDNSIQVAKVIANWPSSQQPQPSVRDLDIYVFEPRKLEFVKRADNRLVARPDPNIIQKAFLYNNRTNSLVTYLDVIDVPRGKIPSVANKEIKYKTYYDPAIYPSEDLPWQNSPLPFGANVIDGMNWTSAQVGTLWWDLTRAKFLENQVGSPADRALTWNQLYETASIDIYEWVESKVKPSEWDKLDDTNKGGSLGISGKSRYGDSLYSIKQRFDTASGKFINTYYFWVKNRKTVPSFIGRSLSAFDISNLISDPIASGYPCISLIGDNSFVLANVKNLLEGNNVTLNLQYKDLDVKESRVHSQWKLISESPTTLLPKNIETKWIDSLVGVDKLGQPVPNMMLSPKIRYGIGFNPSQSMFVNRLEALKQFVENVNDITRDLLVTENYDISDLFKIDPAPSAVTNKWDISVNTDDELRLVKTSYVRRAVLSPVIQNGKLVSITIIDSGVGYKTAPTISIVGTGSNASAICEIDDTGKVVAIVITNSGQNYIEDSTLVVVRPFTVLVLSDSTVYNKWSVRSWNPTAQSWDIVSVQSYNVSNFWKYADWYTEGYNQFTKIDHIVDNTYQLATLESNIGDIVKVNNLGTRGWALLEKYNSSVTLDYTDNYKLVAKQEGTIQLTEDLYLVDKVSDGYDELFYDLFLYDNYPIEEIRIIINFVKDKLLINDLYQNYLKLFFSSVRYLLKEQLFVDWIFKTSFVKVQHNAGLLKQPVTYNSDSLPSFESYVEEVKPYRTKIREYVSSYSNKENTRSTVTDFDLPVSINSQLQIAPINVTVKESATGAEIVTNSENLSIYPWKFWYDNASFKVISIDILDAGEGYLSVPIVEISGGYGSGATAKAILEDGKITAIEVTSSGAGYFKAPIVNINGSISETGRPCRAIAKIGNELVRSNKISIKFDRTSKTYFITDLANTEEFVGNGVRKQFSLKWAPRTISDTYKVLIGIEEIPSSEYAIIPTPIIDGNRTVYKGTLIFNNAPSDGETITVTYEKDFEHLSATDRINYYYNPVSGQYGKGTPDNPDYSQLMSGVDYAGNIISGTDFSTNPGWGMFLWTVEAWDEFDGAYEYNFNIENTLIRTYTMLEPPKAGEKVNIYLNNNRIDYDPELEEFDPQKIEIFVGDNVTTDIIIPDYIPLSVGDILTFRKENTESNFDTSISGGNLSVLSGAYSTATGLRPDEILLDGDSFVTPMTSYAPEEVVPGQIVDTVAIKVFTRPMATAPNIIFKNYVSDGNEDTYEIGQNFPTESSIIIRLKDNILEKTEYSIDWTNNTVTLNSVPAEGEIITLISFGFSSTTMLDYDSFVSDGVTTEYVTKAPWINNLNSIVLVDGSTVEYELFRTDESFEDEFYSHIDLVGLRFRSAPPAGKLIVFMIDRQDRDVINNINITSIDTNICTTSQVHKLKINDQFVPDFSSNGFVKDTTYYVRAIISSTKVTFSAVENGPELNLTDGVTEITGSISRLDNVNENSSIVKSQEIIYGTDHVIGDPTTYTLTNLTSYEIDTPKISPLDANVIVRLGDTILVPASIIYFNTVDDVLTYTLPSYKFSASSGLLPSDIEVVLDGELLDPADYTVDTLEVSITINEEAFIDNKQLAVIVNKDNDYKINMDGTITFNTGVIGEKYEVISFYNHSTLKINRTVNLLTPSTSLTPGTVDFIEFTNLVNGNIVLPKQVAAPDYVWVIKNGKILSLSTDYILDDSLITVKLIDLPLSSDVIQVILFGKETTHGSYGYSQFKDILNRVHYKRISKDRTTQLAKELLFSDTEIEVLDGSKLYLPPNDPLSIKTIGRIPGIVEINGERIEFFQKEGNTLKQIRRGTLGTSIPLIHRRSLLVIDQGVTETIPYNDKEIESVVDLPYGTCTINGTILTVTSLFSGKLLPGNFINATVNSNSMTVATIKILSFGEVIGGFQTYNIDQDLLVEDEVEFSGALIDEIPANSMLSPQDTANANLTDAELTAKYKDVMNVFVGGFRLKKNPYVMYAQLAGASPEGDKEFPADFEIKVNSTGNKMVKLTNPASSRIRLVKKLGRLWTDPNKTLGESTTSQAIFLKDTETVWPQYIVDKYQYVLMADNSPYNSIYVDNNPNDPLELD